MPFVRNVIYGQIVGSGSFSTHIDVGLGETPVEITQSQLDGYAEAVWAAVKLNMLAAGDKALSFASTQVTYRGVKSYLYETYSSVSAFMVGQSTGAAVAGTGSPTMPPQIAIVATMVSGLAGKNGRGRMYVPACGQSISSAWQCSTSDAQSLATQIADAIAAVALVPLAGLGTRVPSVISRTLGIGYPIVSVRIDTVFDTMRSRRDKIVPAARVVAAVPVG